MAVVSQDELSILFTLRCSTHSNGVLTASSNSVTSGSSVSSRIAVTMSDRLHFHIPVRCGNFGLSRRPLIGLTARVSSITGLHLEKTGAIHFFALMQQHPD
jgi:hypothetical protein